MEVGVLEAVVVAWASLLREYTDLVAEDPPRGPSDADVYLRHCHFPLLQPLSFIPSHFRDMQMQKTLDHPKPRCIRLRVASRSRHCGKKCNFPSRGSLLGSKSEERSLRDVKLTAAPC